MTTLTRIKSAPVESSLPTFRNGINRLLDDAFRSSGWHAMPGTFASPTPPPTALDVLETADAYLVMADVPGMGPEDIDIQLEGKALTISGQKSPPDHDAQPLCRERAYGSFCRTVALPASIEPDDVSASYDRGVVTVRVPKAEVARARRIEVLQES